MTISTFQCHSSADSAPTSRMAGRAWKAKMKAALGSAMLNGARPPPR
ncbi:hypothetical protein [Caulobacter sp. UC70_42]